jgi:hypothetical protein
MLNTTCCNYNADTASIAVITSSVVGFFIIFYVATFLLTREGTALGKDPSGKLARRAKDPSYRLLIYLSNEKTIERFLTSSMIYLFAVLVSLINHCINIFLNDCILLFISLILAVIATFILFCELSKVLVKAWKGEKGDIDALIEEINSLKLNDDKEWLTGKKGS